MWVHAACQICVLAICSRTPRTNLLIVGMIRRASQGIGKTQWLEATLRFQPKRIVNQSERLVLLEIRNVSARRLLKQSRLEARSLALNYFFVSYPKS
jgi:hypothetical protein